MSASLSQLVAVRSQLARAVLAALEAHAGAIDVTPWVQHNGKAIRPSDVAVELRVVGSRRPLRASAEGPTATPGVTVSGSLVDATDADRYELPTDLDNRTTERWTQAIRRHRRRLLLQGGPGSGKSFVTRQTVVERLRSVKTDLEARRVGVADTPVVVWVTATSLADATGVDLIEEGLLRAFRGGSPGRTRSSAAAFVATWFESALRCRDALVVVDALDEVPSERAVNLAGHLAELFRLDGRVILTCRTSQWPALRAVVPSGSMEAFELVPLDRRELREMARRMYTDSPDIGARLIARLQRNSALRHTCTTPLRLLFVCLLERDGTLSDDTNYAELYTHLLRNLLTARWRAKRPAWATDVHRVEYALVDVVRIGAALFKCQPTSNRFTVRDWENAAEAAKLDLVAARSLYLELLRIGLLVAAGYDRSGALCASFVHRTILEFCAARVLAELPTEDWLAEVRQHLWFAPEWLEVLTFLASAVLDATLLIAAVERENDDVFGSMLALRARLFGAAQRVDAACESRMTDAVLQMLDAAIESNFPVTFGAPPSQFGENILQTIVVAIGPKMVPALAVALHKDRDYAVRAAAAGALGALVDPTAFDPLLGVLHWDLDERVRARSVYALRGLDDDRAVEPLLLELSLESDKNLRAIIASTLGGLGDPRAIEGLRYSLRDNDRWVRSSAAEALCALRCRCELEPLLAALAEDTDGNVRSSAAEALGELGDPAAADALIAVLRADPDRLVRVAAAGALGALGDPRALEPLLDSLQDRAHLSPRAYAARALGVLGDARAVDSLIAVFRNGDDLRVLEEVTGALGAIGDIRAVEPLLGVLRVDPESRMREFSARALADLGDRRAIEALIAAFLNDSDKGVQAAAADAFCKLRDPRAVEPLLGVLSELSSNMLGISVADALGAIGDPRAVEPLISIVRRTPEDHANRLLDGEVTMYSSAAEALCVLGDSRAYHTLAAYLHKHPSFDQRFSTAMKGYSERCRRPLRWSEVDISDL